MKPPELAEAEFRAKLIGKERKFKVKPKPPTPKTAPLPKVARIVFDDFATRDQPMFYEDAFYFMQKGILKRQGVQTYGHSLNLATFRVDEKALSLQDWYDFRHKLEEARKAGAKLSA